MEVTAKEKNKIEEPNIEIVFNSYDTMSYWNPIKSMESKNALKLVRAFKVKKIMERWNTLY